MSAPVAKLHLGTIVRETLRTCREQWRLLLVAGFAVFLPLGLLESLGDRLQELDFDNLDDVAVAGVIAFAFGQAGTALLGEVFYAGVVTVGVSEARAGGRPKLREVARKIPYLRLAAVDVLYALIALAGLLLFIAPGIVFLVWFAVAGPVVEVEGRRPLAALRRSRELVRGSFWRVFAIVIPLEFVTDALVDGAGELGHAALGDSLVAEWVGSTLGGVVATALWAAVVVVVTFELIDLQRGRAGNAPEAAIPG